METVSVARGEALARPSRTRVAMAVVGVGYVLSWVAGLLIPAPSPALNAPGSVVVSALAGHQAAETTQFVLTEGLPAGGLAVVLLALAVAARRSGAVPIGRLVTIAGVTAAVVSLTQCVLGVLLAGGAEPGTSGLLFHLVGRLDGAKELMLAVAAMSAAAVPGLLPRWLRGLAVALSVSIAATGVGYLMLQAGLASLAYVSLPLLLLFISATGITLARSGR